MRGRRRIIFVAKLENPPEHTVLRPETLAVDATFVASKDRSTQTGGVRPHFEEGRLR